MVFPNHEKLGDIFVNSFPKDAFIYLNNNYIYKRTPDSILSLQKGFYNITLKKNGYLDTLFGVFIDEAEKKFVTIELKNGF